MLLEKRLDGSFNLSGTTTIESKAGKPTKIVGYAAVWHRAGDPGTEYQLMPGLVERVSRTAFDKALNSDADVMCCFNHDVNWLLGRRIAGTLNLSTDASGLKYEVTYDPDDPQHQSIMRKVQRGDLRGASFWFQMVSEKVSPTATGYIRELTEVRLIECGPVAMPAYPSTTAGSRGEPSGAVVGSVRWVAENPTHPQVVAARLMQLRAERLEEIESDLRADRLAQIAYESKLQYT